MKSFVALLLFISLASAQQLNRQMKVDSFEESSKINPEQDKSLVIVHSQVQNLRFDSNRKIDRVNQVSSGDWEVWIPAGTHVLKIDADGFERLELPAQNYGKKKAYELKIVAVGFAPTARADENLIDVTFQINESNVYSSYNDLAPTLTKGNTIAYKIPKGDYTFRFQKEGFADSVQKISVTEASIININLRPGTTTKKFSLPSMVVIKSEPSGAEILINGQKYGTTPYQGEIIAGTHQLELRKPLYYPNISTFTVEESKTLELPVILKPRFGYITVKSNKPNAKITIDGKQYGSVPLLKKEIESTRHTLKVEAELYHPFNQEFSISDGEQKDVMAALNPAFGSIEINSFPEQGAEVYFDGQNVGKTPYKSDQILSAKYIVKVTKSLYNTTEEEVIVEDGKTVTKNFALSKNFGILTVNAPNSIIYLNHQRVAENTYNAQLLPARYSVRAERGEKYIPAEKEVFIKVGESELVKLDPEPRLGSLSILVEPVEASKAEIYVNDKLKGNAPLVLPLLIGDYSITAKQINYLDVTEKVSMKERESMKLNLQMISYEGSRQQKIGKWATWKWISIGTAALATAAAVYFNSQANSNYDSYKKAGTSSDADNFRNLTQKNNTLYKVSLTVGAAAVVGTIVSWIGQSSY
jgi:hypothetical protein